jgi:hypothetical protein
MTIGMPRLLPVCAQDAAPNAAHQHAHRAVHDAAGDADIAAAVMAQGITFCCVQGTVSRPNSARVANDQSIIAPATQASAAVSLTQATVVRTQGSNVAWAHVVASGASVPAPQPTDRLMPPRTAPVKLVVPLPRPTLLLRVLW